MIRSVRCEFRAVVSPDSALRESDASDTKKLSKGCFDNESPICYFQSLPNASVPWTLADGKAEYQKAKSLKALFSNLLARIGTGCFRDLRSK